MVDLVFAIEYTNDTAYTETILETIAKTIVDFDNGVPSFSVGAMRNFETFDVEKNRKWLWRKLWLAKK